MADADPDIRTQFRIADLPTRKVTRFDIVPDKAQMAEMQQSMDLLGLSKLRFTGTLKAVGKKDWQLDAKLGATVVQACTVSLDPVSTRLQEDITRRYSPDAELDEDEAPAEMEMPEDDTLEPLPQTLDLMEILAESLALALPLYPRASGLAPVAQTAEPKGAEPISDEALKPFAGLSALRDKLNDPGSNESS